MAGPVDLNKIYNGNTRLLDFTDRQDHLTSVNTTMLDVDDKTQFLRQFNYLTLNAQKAPAGMRAYDVFQVIQFIPNTSTHPSYSALILFNLNIHNDCEPDNSGFRWIYILFDNTKVANTSLLELLYEKTVPGFESYYFLPKEGFVDLDHTERVNIEKGFSKVQTEYNFHPSFFTDEEIDAVAEKIQDPIYMPFQYAYDDGTYTRGPLARLNTEPNKAIDLKTDWISSDQKKYQKMEQEKTVPFLVVLLTANLNHFGFREKFLKDRQAVAYLCFGVHDSTNNFGNYYVIKDGLAVACLQEMNANFLAHKVNLPPNWTVENFREWATFYPWLGLVLGKTKYNSELDLSPDVDLLNSNRLQTRDDYTKYITVHKPKKAKIRIPKGSWSSYIGRGGADGIPFILKTRTGHKIICRKLKNGNLIMGCYEYYNRSTKSKSNLLKCYGMVINPNLAYNNATYQLNFEKSSVCICRLQLYKTVLLFNPVYECLSPLGMLSTMDNLIVGNVHFACRGQGDGASSSAKDELMYFVFVVCPAIFNEKGSNFYMRSSYARVLRVLGDFNLPVNWEEHELLSIIHILQDESGLKTFFDSHRISTEQRKACNDFYHTPLRTMTTLGKEGNAWRLAVSLVHTDTATYNGGAPVGGAGTTAPAGAAGLVRNYDCEFVCFWELNKQANDTRITFYKQQLVKGDLPPLERKAFEQALLEMEGFEETFKDSDSIVCCEKYLDDHDAILTVSAVPSSDDARFTKYLRSRSDRGILPYYRGNPEKLDTALRVSRKSKGEYKKLARTARTSSAARSLLSRAAQSAQETGKRVASRVLGRENSEHEPSSSTGARKTDLIMTAYLARLAAKKLRERAKDSKLGTVKEDSEDSQMSSGGSINKMQLIKEQIKIIKDKYKNTKLNKYLIQIDNLKHKIILQTFTDKLLKIKEKIKDYKTEIKANPNKKEKYIKHIDKLIEKFNVLKQEQDTLKQNIKLKHTKDLKSTKDPKPTKNPTKNPKPTTPSKPTKNPTTPPKPTKNPTKNPKSTKTTLNTHQIH